MFVLADVSRSESVFDISLIVVIGEVVVFSMVLILRPAIYFDLSLTFIALNPSSSLNHTR
jgi:hypothetical protein